MQLRWKDDYLTLGKALVATQPEILNNKLHAFAVVLDGQRCRRNPMGKIGPGSESGLSLLSNRVPYSFRSITIMVESQEGADLHGDDSSVNGLFIYMASGRFGLGPATELSQVRISALWTDTIEFGQQDDAFLLVRICPGNDRDAAFCRAQIIG